MSVLRPRAEAIPARALPILYFAVGYLALPLAFALVGLAPRSVAGFFYHPRLITIVHLVTVGWITSAILGSLYIVLPIALMTPLAARRGDYWAFASFLIGAIGMIAHFWIEEFGGMAWSGLMVAGAILYVGRRVVPPLLRAPIQSAVKLHVTLAFVNMLLAATAGILLGFDKVYHFLPGYVISNVLAHAHLAALGWACMMAIGIGYRLLPMVLATSMPQGGSLIVSAVLLEIGAVGLFLSLLVRSAWSAAFAACAMAAFVWFAAHVRRMRRRTRAAGLPKPDVGAWHAMQALTYLALAVAAGMPLTLLDPSPFTMRLALVYGVFGLLGFLAQLVMGMQMRIVPLAAWYWTFVRTSQVPALSAHALASRRYSLVSFSLWSVAVPMVAAGLFFDLPFVLSCGAWAAFASTVVAGIEGLFVVRYAFGRPAWLSWTRADDAAARRGTSERHDFSPRWS
jgi:hypothetical protein